jgi:predicted transcriptional regulator
VGALAPTETGILDLPDDGDEDGEEAALRVIQEAWKPSDLQGSFDKDPDLFPEEGEATRVDGVVTSGVPDRFGSAITEERVLNQYDGAVVQVGSYTGPLLANPNARDRPVERLTHRIKYVAHLAALGMTSSEIAERSGYSPATVNKLLRAPLVSLEVERARQSFLRQDPDTSLRIMIPKALTAISEVLDSTEEKRSLKVDTAFKLLERTHGKPKQSVDMGGNLLKDLFELLDQRDATSAVRTIEVKADEAQVVEARAADPLDEALEEFSVGVMQGGDKK